jgi:lipopolysaccharide/colanic/teichoic acid biosynthesis glycosyltransferase
MKRLLDVAIAGTALVVTSPLLAVLAAAIRLESPGPALFIQTRVGKDHRPIRVAKLRTMVANGARNGLDITAADDARVTRIGALLRRTKLDELPQLWNVLRGDMSIVGPRPIRPLFFEGLAQEIPAYWQRLVVPPGITGFAQLRLTREITWAEKLAHDFEYIADRSVRLYFEVVAETVWLVLSRPFKPPED